MLRLLYCGSWERPQALGPRDATVCDEGKVEFDERSLGDGTVPDQATPNTAHTGSVRKRRSKKEVREWNEEWEEGQKPKTAGGLQKLGEVRMQTLPGGPRGNQPVTPHP